MPPEPAHFLRAKPKALESDNRGQAVGGCRLPEQGSFQPSKLRKSRGRASAHISSFCACRDAVLSLSITISLRRFRPAAARLACELA